MTQRPRARKTDPNTPCVAWRCVGIKGDKYHVAFGSSWWDACKRWYETSPDHDWTLDIPF